MKRFPLAILLTLVFCCAATTVPAAELSGKQRVQLLQEASVAYDQGLQASESDVATAKDSFETAADKYHLLIDSGIQNARLYENLGNASLQSGQLGSAIAAYEHAAALAPDDNSIRQHLEHAHSLRDGGTSEAEQVSLFHRFSTWNQRIPMNLRLFGAIVAWVGLWSCLIGWLVRRSAGWRRGAVGMAVVASLLIGSIGWDWSQHSQTEYGIVTTPTKVYTHDGETFPLVFEQPLSEGTRFNVVDHRDAWLQIELPDGSSGWIPSRTAELISPRAYPWS